MQPEDFGKGVGCLLGVQGLEVVVEAEEDGFQDERLEGGEDCLWRALERAGTGENVAHAFDMEQAYGWPGNVRKLQNLIERAMILSDVDTFSPNEDWFKRGPTRRLAGSTVALGEACSTKKRKGLKPRSQKAEAVSRNQQTQWTN